MLLSKALEGWLLDYLASGKSPYTTEVRSSCLQVFARFIGDVEIETITPVDLNRFMVHLRTDRVPVRMSGSEAPLSLSAIDNYWKALRIFFSWCNEALGLPRPDRNLKRQHYQSPEVLPLTQDEIKALIKASQTTTLSNRTIRREFANRDMALLLALLDTGLRVGELSRLKIKDINMTNGEVTVIPYGSGAKSRARVVILGVASRRALWVYLAKRKNIRDEDGIFVSRNNRPISPNEIRRMLNAFGKAAGIRNVHPHRFRHTFAIEYLRNGGDPYTLQRLLGHASMDMVKRYLNIVRADIETAHRKASPVDKWRL